MATTTSPSGLTGVGLILVLVITALSLAHHVDHVFRDVTGWPLEGGFNPFSASLLAYPLILTGVVLSRRQRAGARFWTLMAGGGAAFIIAIHLGPAAADSVADIPDQYDSPLATVLSLVVLAAFSAFLVAHCLYEWRRLSVHRRSRGSASRALTRC